MQRCLDLAQNAKGHTAPNPMVGAVLVYNDRIIGEGWHHYYGGDHAEVNCLKNVAEADRHFIPESTLYVNLEPCAHQGITPPCAARLIKEGIKKVIIANSDPFELVNGTGITLLKEAGIAVETGLMEKEGLGLNRRFFCFHQQKRPYIILKWAQTADGFIAPADRSRLQITGPESQQLLHRWRTEEAAILVGNTTAMNDNPQLTSRLHEGRQPLRIVLDRQMQIPHTHHNFDNTAATWIINEQHEWLEGNIHYVQLKFDDTVIAQLMAHLYKNKILSLIVEGGAALLHSFLQTGLWDEARIFTGNTSLGDGIPAPHPGNGSLAYTSGIGGDNLRFFVNQDSAYPYAPGMEL